MVSPSSALVLRNRNRKKEKIEKDEEEKVRGEASGVAMHLSDPVVLRNRKKEIGNKNWEIRNRK